MKNLIRLVMLFLISSVGFLQAQCPTDAFVSADGSCLFLVADWEDVPDTIFAFEDTLYRGGVIADEGLQVYSVDTASLCTDTTGSTAFVDTLIFGIGDNDFICYFDEGTYQPPCPDSAFMVDQQSCLTLFVDTTNAAQLPDTIYYGTNEYTWFSQDEDRVTYSQMEDPCDSDVLTALNGEIEVGPSVCSYSTGVLPITILAFEVVENDGTISLSWKINSDEPTRNLVLQRSYDGVDWSNVHEQDLASFGAGEIMDGQYADLEVEQPNVYYRLHISGVSGETTYSSILPVTLENKVVNNLFYQSQSRSIMIKAGQNFTGEMYLFNTQGQNVLKKDVQMQKNTFQEISIQGELTPGIYFVKFDNGLIPPSKIFID